MKRWIWLVAVIIVLGSLSVAAEEKPLQYVVHGSNELINGYKALFEQFTAETGIPVEIIVVGSQRQKWEKIVTLVAAGVSPDVVGGVSTEFGEFADKGLLRPLDDLMSRDKVNTDAVIPIFLDALKYQGRQYLLPYGSSALPMFYNKDYVAEAGLPNPPTEWDTASWTYERFVEYGRKLTKRDGNGTVTRWGISGPYWDSWITLPYAWGGKWVSDDLTQFEGTTPEAVAAVQSLQDLIGEGIMKNAYPSGALTNGTAAMGGTGTWTIKSLLKEQIDWDFMPWFRVKDTAQAAIFPIGYGILSSSTNTQNAWKLVKFLTWNQDANLQYALTAGALPALRANLPKWANQLTQMANVTPSVVISQVATHGAVIQIRKTTAFTAINQVMSGTVNQVLQGQKSAKIALEEVADQINSLLE